MLMRSINSQRGVTIIELLVGLAVGVLVVGGAITMYVSSIRSSNNTLAATKLNQEIAALMNVIGNDVRRAGYWEAATIGSFDLNPFSQPGDTLLTVYDDMTNNTAQAATGSGECVAYAYDATYLPGNVAGTVDAADLFGFRLNGTVVQMLQTGIIGSLDCAAGTWQNVTDPNLIEITALTFDLANSLCLNGAEPNGVDDDADATIDNAAEYNCYVSVPANGSGDRTAETRELVVTIAGRLANDISVQATATESVRVRNDYLRIR
jgi:type IV pilus assembly protein PilW